MRLIFDEVMDDNGLAWAPIRDTWNEWVQVGNGGQQCVTYVGMYKKRPDWGTPGSQDSEEITQHIMCCLEQPLGDDNFDTPKLPTPPDVEAEHGENVDDPIPPPPLTGGTLSDVTDDDIIDKPHVDMDEDNTTGPAFTNEKTVLTKFDVQVRDEYNPFWFDENDGWDGSTYEASRRFCESIPNGPDSTFHLCPIKALCPNGFEAEKPLAYQMEAFGGGVQWSPISNNNNGWVMVGEMSETQPSTCRTFLELYHHDPEWGIDGTQTELKKHILCCQVHTDYDVAVKKGDYEQTEAQSPTQGLVQ